MAGQEPIPSDCWPDFFGPVVVPLFGDAAIPDDDGGSGTSTATVVVKEVVFCAIRRTAIHRITILSPASQTVDIKFYKHASGVAAASGTQINTTATAVVANVPLTITLTETANILEEGNQLSIVLSAAPAEPITAQLWLSHGRTA